MTVTRSLDDLSLRRVVLVHAHPDDESLWTGVVTAHLVAQGAEAHVVTCTLGEEGEVIPPDLRHLEGDGPALAAHRRGELAGAMRVLGATSHVLSAGSEGRPGLQGAAGSEGGGGPGARWRDSGMAGTPAAGHPDAFASAGGAAVEALADLLRELRPDGVITYDPHGGYEHPDHVAAHRATLAAVASLAVRGDLEAPPHVLQVVVPRSWAMEDRAWLAEHVHRTDVVVPGPDDPYPPSVVPDDLVTHVVVDPAAARVQASALREHPTQVTVHDGYYALSNDIATRLAGREAFVLVDPPAVTSTGGPDE
ncbi:PIG-L family deacetylase [Arsenicicoccus cauae]|uniref:N-acetyl-1-D-myo-inositol-2-amino-2-deoxy-alpha-D-glucopyranoside deacetylase n=1 Tax=Arsenicicoccus cauae TaxID=2663847 RepID=A0A6I3INZ3_9MICO|nr:PIG-L family deacetylase [Arsenicicoccus cauae]MTB73395.1 N-acetyl-1-D-myo-inositol-2-amino-2-deoxy-alpha-D-glucopyranoside deacetylase [Arsenicicoccus cauae]